MCLKSLKVNLFQIKVKENDLNFSENQNAKIALLLKYNWNKGEDSPHVGEVLQRRPNNYIENMLK